MKTLCLAGAIIVCGVLCGAPYCWATLQVEITFRRADANHDGNVNIADATFTLNYLFVPGSSRPTCDDTVDSNDDGSLNIADGIFTLNALFLPSSPPVPAPGIRICGFDPTIDPLGCVVYRPCVCAGFAGIPCNTGEFCDLPHGGCDIADAQGQCVPAPGGLSGELRPSLRL